MTTLILPFSTAHLCAPTTGTRFLLAQTLPHSNTPQPDSTLVLASAG